MSNTPRWYFRPLEDNKLGGCRLDLKKSRRDIFQWIFALGIIWGGMIRFVDISLIVALSPGHSDITRFLSWSPIAKRNHLDCAEKIPNMLRRLAPLTFLIRVQAFRDALCGELPHVQIFMNDGTNQLTWDAQLLSYWLSRNPAVFQDYIGNLINNCWGGHCFGSSWTRSFTGGKVTTFKLGHPVFDGRIRWCIFSQCFCQNVANFLRRFAL